MNARTSTVVLVPGPLGGLLLYGRAAPGPLRFVADITHPEQLCTSLLRFRKPCVIVLCGTRHADKLLGPTLTHGDLHIVPIDWLASIPPGDVLARATLAARLATAHRRQPIIRIYANEDDPPF